MTNTTTQRSLIIIILALLLIILCRRSRTLDTPHGRVLVGNGGADRYQMEMEQWLQSHNHSGS